METDGLDGDRDVVAGDRHRKLGEDPIALKLALTSYLLSLAVFIPLSGWAADRFGARTVFRAAIIVFTLGSAACGFASSLFDFVLFRIVQGIGGAMMVPVAGSSSCARCRSRS